MVRCEHSAKRITGIRSQESSASAVPGSLTGSTGAAAPPSFRSRPAYSESLHFSRSHSALSFSVHLFVKHLLFLQAKLIPDSLKKFVFIIMQVLKQIKYRRKRKEKASGFT